MLVEAHLGDPGLGNDPVDADGPDAFLVEQPVGGFQDALAGFRSALVCVPCLKYTDLSVYCQVPVRFFDSSQKAAIQDSDKLTEGLLALDQPHPALLPSFGWSANRDDQGAEIAS